jgi:hypothetical protein
MKSSIANAAKDLRYYTHLAESPPRTAARRCISRSTRRYRSWRAPRSMIEARGEVNGMQIVKR